MGVYEVVKSLMMPAAISTQYQCVKCRYPATNYTLFDAREKVASVKTSSEPLANLQAKIFFVRNNSRETESLVQLDN